jgi:hypothetical protein
MKKWFEWFCVSEIKEGRREILSIGLTWLKPSCHEGKHKEDEMMSLICNLIMKWLSLGCDMHFRARVINMVLFLSIHSSIQIQHVIVIKISLIREY